MKVLYIGAYRDGTGWGHCAIDSILALDAAGVEVVPRCIKLSENSPELPSRLVELERSRDGRGADIVIQNILPYMTDYSGRFEKNICYYFTETSDFRSSTWAECLNLLDEAWVPCRYNRQAALDSFVDVPIKVVPPATDLSRFERSHPLLPLREELGDSFLFYTIGEATRRKNFAAIVKAFHLEFDPIEPVDLLIKTNMRGMKPARVREKMAEDCRLIKQALNLYPSVDYYKRELILTSYLSEEAILSLHATGDCFIGPSYAEGWGVPAFDAMAMGKTPIVTAWGGFLDFMTEETGWLVPGYLEPVFGMNNVHYDLYTGHQEWYSVDIRALRRAMREAYENKELRKEKAFAGMDRAYDFSYAKVGALMRQALES